MADEYIKREDALIEVRKRLHVGIEIDLAEIALIRIPAADVRPVVRGRWKGDGLNDYRCSLCDHVTFGKPNFCPNCGAKMDEGNEK